MLIEEERRFGRFLPDLISQSATSQAQHAEQKRQRDSGEHVSGATWFYFTLGCVPQVVLI